MITILDIMCEQYSLVVWLGSLPTDDGMSNYIRGVTVDITFSASDLKSRCAIWASHNIPSTLSTSSTLFYSSFLNQINLEL